MVNRLNYNPDGHQIDAELILVPESSPYLVAVVHHSLMEDTVEIWENENKTGTELVEENYTGTVSESGYFQVDYTGESEDYPKRGHTILFHESQADTQWYIWYKSMGDFNLWETPRIPIEHGNERHDEDFATGDEITSAISTHTNIATAHGTWATPDSVTSAVATHTNIATAHGTFALPEDIYKDIPHHEYLMAHYTFNENAENTDIFDFSRHGNNGNAQRNTNLLTSPSIMGTGISFNGIDDYIEVPHSDSLSSIKDITISVWIHTNDRDLPNQAIIEKRGAWNRFNYYLNLQDGHIRFAFYGGDYRAFNSTSKLESYTWTHVAVTYNTNNVMMYINGELDSPFDFYEDMVENEDSLFIGRRADDATNYFNGVLEDLRIYRRTLHRNEIQAIYRDGSGTEYGGQKERIWATPDNARFPTVDEKAALAGSHGTPSVSNPYITVSDPRVRDNVYSVMWDQGDDVLYRSDLARNMTQPEFNNVFPWSEMKRCVLNDDGTVNYYLDPNDSALKDDGTTPSVLDGTDGQVMVEIPNFYYRWELLGGVYKWSIAEKEGTGYKPAFIFNDVVKDHVYVSAFEGSYNSSTTAMESRSGVQPSTGVGGTSNYPTGTIDGCRGYAHQRNTIGSCTGWGQLNFRILSAIQLLYLVEYASFDSQGQIGEGIVWLNDDHPHNRAQNTGHTVPLGNYSGESAAIDPVENSGTMQSGKTTANNKAVSYRGIENLWGNIWAWVDGINIGSPSNYRLWIADHDYEADKFEAPYVDTGLSVLGTNDTYPGDILWGIDLGFLASATGGSDSSHLHDNWRVGTSFRVAIVGGSWLFVVRAGAFCWHLLLHSGITNRSFGSRLTKI